MIVTLPPFPVEQDLHPELRKFLEETRADIGALKNAVIGNEEYKQLGLVDKVVSLEEKQAETDKKIFKASVILTTLGTIFVFSKDIIVEMFSRK